MPSKNTVKDYGEDEFYHVYNRGAGKQEIFIDDQDYRVFLSYLKICLSSREDLQKQDIEEIISLNTQRKLRTLDLSAGLELISFCLMPNHYHMVIYQKDEDSITRMMRSIMTSYSMYFNKKHDRSGHLYQGAYKASRVDSDGYLAHITRYVHLNSIEKGVQPQEDPYSSYQYYLGQKKAKWLKSDKVLSQFKDSQDYKLFVEDYIDTKKGLDKLKTELKEGLKI